MALRTPLIIISWRRAHNMRIGRFPASGRDAETGRYGHHDWRCFWILDEDRRNIAAPCKRKRGQLDATPTTFKP
jgi:hypothetical protein